MSIVKCGNCGATPNSGALVCEYCGAQVGDIMTVADELKALRELNLASQRLAQSAGDPDELGRKAGLLWKTAFVPKHVDAIASALLEAAQRVTGADPVSEAMLARASTLLTAYRQASVGDSSAAARTDEFAANVAAAESRLRRAHTKGAVAAFLRPLLRPYVLGPLVLAGACVAIQAEHRKHSNDFFYGPKKSEEELAVEKRAKDQEETRRDREKCKDAGSSYESIRNDALGHCVKLCSDGEKWACDMVEIVKKQR